MHQLAGRGLPTRELFKSWHLDCFDPINMIWVWLVTLVMKKQTLRAPADKNNYYCAGIAKHNCLGYSV